MRPVESSPRRARTAVAPLALVIAVALAPVFASGPAQAAQPVPPRGHARAVQPRTAPVIVVYTMGRGAVLWEKFGHAAICAEYPREPRFSVCYNYGTTDFAAPVTLGWTFVRGQSRFWVSTDRPSYMIRRYIGFDRTIWRQTLPLTEDQARAAADRLNRALLPENRFYTYHHFHDNCTTRVRDIIDEVTGGALRPGTDGSTGVSFRDYARRGFAEETWMLVITDLLLGRVADETADNWQVMFLPSYMREAIRDKLGVEPVLVYQRQGRALSDDPGMGGRWLYVVLGLGFALLIGLARLRRRYERLAIAPAAVLLLLISLPMWFLFVISSLDALRYNEALLLFWPTDIAVLLLRPRRRERYAQVRVAALVVVVLLSAVGVLLQPLGLLSLLALAPMAALAVPQAHVATLRGKLRGGSGETPGTAADPKADDKSK